MFLKVKFRRLKKNNKTQISYFLCMPTLHALREKKRIGLLELCIVQEGQRNGSRQEVLSTRCEIYVPNNYKG